MLRWNRLKSRAVSDSDIKANPARVGFVSLGCPKALVDSERILSRLRSEGYETAADYAGADVVVVNTVITSYSIHYTKLYEHRPKRAPRRAAARRAAPR